MLNLNSEVRNSKVQSYSLLNCIAVNCTAQNCIALICMQLNYEAIHILVHISVLSGTVVRGSALYVGAMGRTGAYIEQNNTELGCGVNIVAAILGAGLLVVALSDLFV